MFSCTRTTLTRMREASSWAAAPAPPPEKGIASKQKSRKYLFIMILLWRVCFLDWFLTKCGGGRCGQGDDLALPQLLAGLSSGADHGGPILEVGGEDLGGHVAGQFGDEAVEHDGGVAEFIREAGPVQVGRFPRLAEEAAGRAPQEGGGGFGA